ncbi:MAG: hypothetical protein MUO29_03410 [Desulfobacterales bacterium]|nr:hypothetical protein [Desulfobacterales bacterium]
MKVILLSLALVVTLGVSSAVVAQPGEFVKGVLQPLADGFPNKAITLIVIDEPGSRDGIYARTMQEALRGISPVNILVSDEEVAQGGTFYKMGDLLTRPGGDQGYFPFIMDLWGTSLDPLMEPVKEETGKGIDDLQVIINTESLGYFVMQTKTVPWGPTWADFVKYANANPGKAKYGASNPGSGTDIGCSFILSKAGVLDKLKKITSKNTAEGAKNVAAGAADIGCTDAQRMIPHLEAGRVTPLMWTGPKVPAPFDKDPNIVTWEKAGISKGNLGAMTAIATTKEVPKAHVEWLFKLFQAAAATEVYKKRETTYPGLVIAIKGPEEAQKIPKQMQDYANPIIHELGLALDQQKK